MQSAGIAQLVEQRTENPRVTGSSPVPGIQVNQAKSSESKRFGAFYFGWLPYTYSNFWVFLGLFSALTGVNGVRYKSRRRLMLILRQLARRMGEVPEALRSRLNLLSLEQLENLGEVLLDFAAIADLESWFKALE